MNLFNHHQRNLTLKCNVFSLEYLNTLGEWELKNKDEKILAFVENLPKGYNW
jgi:hypothetical protein